MLVLTYNVYESIVGNRNVYLILLENVPSNKLVNDKILSNSRWFLIKKINKFKVTTMQALGRNKVTTLHYPR